jgi:hypothetical protein
MKTAKQYDEHTGILFVTGTWKTQREEDTQGHNIQIKLGISWRVITGD